MFDSHGTHSQDIFQLCALRTVIVATFCGTPTSDQVGYAKDGHNPGGESKVCFRLWFMGHTNHKPSWPLPVYQTGEVGDVM